MCLPPSGFPKPLYAHPCSLSCLRLANLVIVKQSLRFAMEFLGSFPGVSVKAKLTKTSQSQSPKWKQKLFTSPGTAGNL